MKKEKIICFICLFAVLLFLSSCSKNQKVVFSGSFVQESVVEAEFGSVVASLTSSAYSLGSESVEVFISKISLIKSDDKGAEYFDILNNQLSFDLVKLRNDRSRNYLGQVKISKGFYESLVLIIDKVLVDGKEAFIPKKEIVLPINLNVKPNSVNLVELNLVIDDSLRTTLSSEQIFAPVVEVSVNLLNTLEIESGKSLSYKKDKNLLNKKYGMTLTGSIVEGVGVWQSAPLKIEKNVLKIVSVEKKQPPKELQPPAPRIIKASIKSDVLTPSKIEVLKNEKVVLKIFSEDKIYGLKINDLGINGQVSKETPLSIDLIMDDEYNNVPIVCSYPCYRREGRVLGQIVLVKRI